MHPNPRWQGKRNPKKIFVSAGHKKKFIKWGNKDRLHRKDYNKLIAKKKKKRKKKEKICKSIQIMNNWNGWKKNSTDAAISNEC